MHYLDNNATTAVDPEVYGAMLPYFMEKYANASGVYSFAQEAKKDLEDARAVAAKFLNADPGEIVFNGGGTESDNTAVKGSAYANRDKGNHIITSRIEHHAVLNACKYLETKDSFFPTSNPWSSVSRTLIHPGSLSVGG